MGNLVRQQVLVSEELWQKIQIVAQSSWRSASASVRQALQRYLAGRALNHHLSRALTRTPLTNPNGRTITADDAETFIDTNVLVYTIGSDSRSYGNARRLLDTTGRIYAIGYFALAASSTDFTKSPTTTNSPPATERYLLAYLSTYSLNCS